MALQQVQTIRLLLAILCLSSTSVLAATEEACMVVTSDYHLDGDFSCNCTGREAAIEVSGPATLTLNGYKVSCDGQPSEAILWLTGDGARARGGTVSGDPIQSYDCVQVNGTNAKVKNMFIKQCFGHCVLVGSGGDGSAITDNKIQDCFLNGVDFKGNNVKVADNLIMQANFNGIAVDAEDGKVLRNTVIASSQDGIIVNRTAGEGGPANAIIKENVIRQSGGTGMRLFGDHHLVSENKVNTALQSCVQLEEFAKMNIVSKNVLQSCGVFQETLEFEGYGIFVKLESNNNTIIENKISITSREGIEMSGDGNEIVDNIISVVNNDGIDISGNWNLVKGNKVKKTRDQGILVDGDNSQIAGNSVADAGRDCIQLNNALNNEVIGNTVTDCGSDGIALIGDSENNTVKKNSALGAGCELDLKDTTSDNDCGTNTWKNNAGEGFPNCTVNGRRTIFDSWE